jgi:hypothetical protein
LSQVNLLREYYTTITKKNDLKSDPGWALVAHAYNPSYSGSRDLEDHSSKPTQANSSAKPHLEKPLQKKKG